MTAFLRFLGWATLAFIVTWFIATPYQHGIAAVASALAARGEFDWVDMELFFPYDLGIYVALCLASAWVSWRVRLRAVGVGLAIMIVLEVLVLMLAVRLLIASSTQPPAQADQTQRFVLASIRILGLAAAGAVWTWFLGWQRLPTLVQAIGTRDGATGRKT